MKTQESQLNIIEKIAKKLGIENLITIFDDTSFQLQGKLKTAV